MIKNHVKIIKNMNQLIKHDKIITNHAKKIKNVNIFGLFEERKKMVWNFLEKSVKNIGRQSPKNPKKNITTALAIK